MSRRHRKVKERVNSVDANSVITVQGRPVEIVGGDKVSLTTGQRVTYDALVGLDGKVKEVVDVRTGDAFRNPLARTGFGTANLLNATEYPLTRMTDNYALMNSLYRDNWVVGNIVSTIPEDMCKNWYQIKTDIDQKLLDRFARMERQTHLKQKIIEGLKWGRLYGGAAGLILVKGQTNDLDKPLNIENINVDDFKGLYIMDRWSGITPSMERIDDMCNSEYGSPKYYEIQDGDNRTVAKVHHSRIVRFIGRELPRYEKQAELDWGASEVETAYQEVIKRDNVSQNIASLTFKANINVYEIENLEQLFSIASTQAQKRFWDMMQAQSILESNLGVKLVNKGDTYKNQTYTFSGLRDVYEGIMMDLAGATHIPVTKLFGRSPAGMNATGQSDLQNYYDYVEQLREAQLRPVIEKLLPIMAMSTFGMIPDDIDFVFNDIHNPSDQKTQIGHQKTQAVVQAFQTGIITQKTAIKELSLLKESYNMFNSIDEDQIANAQDKTINEMQQMSDPLGGLSLGGEGNGGWDEEESNERTPEQMNKELQAMLEEANKKVAEKKLQEEQEELQRNIEEMQNEKIDQLSNKAKKQALSQVIEPNRSSV